MPIACVVYTYLFFVMCPKVCSFGCIDRSHFANELEEMKDKSLATSNKVHAIVISSDSLLDNR